MEKALTVGDVCRICEASAKSVQQWCDDGQLDGVYRIPAMGPKGRQGDRHVPVESLRSFMKRIGMPLKWLDDYLRANQSRRKQLAASSNGGQP